MDDDGKTSNYHVKKLSETNYRTWSKQLDAILDEKDLLEVVLGTETEPVAPAGTANTAEGTSATITPTAEETEAYEAKLALFKKKVKKARAVIISTISDSVMTYVEDEKNPAEIWGILERKYKPKTRTTLLQAIKEFMNAKMEDGDDVEAHLQRVDRLKRRVEEQGEQVTDTVYNGVLLNSVSDSEVYATAVKVLEGDANLTPEIIINRLLEEKRKLGLDDAGKLKLAMLTNQSRGQNRTGTKKSQKTKNDKKSVNCDHCNKAGHTEDKCWTKHPHLKPSKTPKPSEPRVSMRATVSLGESKSSSDKWYIDSGASDHFSPFRDLFNDVETFSKPDVIETAEGTSVYGVGKGSIEIIVMIGDSPCPVILEDVIYAPKMSSNLISTTTLMDRGYEISMRPGDGVTILKDSKIIANTVREGKLYRLKTITYRANVARKAPTVKAVDIETLHRRLGHLGEDDIRKLAKMSTGIEIRPSTLKVCQACLEGKHHRHPVHTPAQHRATELLGRIHSDSSGQITPTSVGGAKYYQLYIDDASRWTTIVPLKGMAAKESL